MTNETTNAGSSPTFWSDIHRYFFHQQTYVRGEDEAGEILALAGVQPGATILDLCCGPGRGASELAARGVRVTGVDHAQPLLDDAAERAAARGLEVEFLCADAREFHRDGAFDLALNLWTSLGYGDDPADDSRILANVHRSLKPGGTFVLETLGKEGLARRLPPRLWFDHDDAAFLIAQEIIVEPDWDRATHRWIVIEGNDRREYRLTHRLYSAAEMRALFAAAGFATVEVYGNFDRSSYATSSRLVVVGQRA
jgi:SAM-dependent methyltransferase